MEIDAVIAWVDGDDPKHIEERNRYRAKRFRDRGLEQNAITSHRFRDNGELRYCVRSIKKHAPWIRHIHVVTDDQYPAYFNVLRARTAGVHFVSHREIYRGLDLIRPVFNSRAIETLIWRIEGLAERFIYFNDDMFLCGRVTPSDFFRDDGKAIIRGTMKRQRNQMDQTKLHGNSKYARAATLAGYPKDQYVCSAHVPHAMFRSAFEEAFEKMRPVFVQNASYRFRDPRQFVPFALHDHLILKSGRAVLIGRSDAVYISGTVSRQAPKEELESRFGKLFEPSTKFACLNNMPSTVERLAVSEEALQQLFGSALPFEQEKRTQLESIALRLRTRSSWVTSARPMFRDDEAQLTTGASKEGTQTKDAAKRDRKVARAAKGAVFQKLLRDVCEQLARRGKGFFLQIGANDGTTNDPLFDTVRAFDLEGLCVEPLPGAFQRLQKSYEHFGGVRMANVAIGKAEGFATLYVPRMPGVAAATGKRLQSLQASAERKSSFLAEVATRIAARKHGIPLENARGLVEEVTVRVTTLADLLVEYSVERVDILQVDVEGYDYEVLKQFDFDRYLPMLVNYEHQHLSAADRENCASMLSARGYVLFRHGRDTCGIRVCSRG